MNTPDGRILPLLRRCVARGLSVSLVPRMFDLINNRLAHESVGGLPLATLRSTNPLGPTFALVELLRAEAAFLVGPVLLHVAMTAATVAGGLRLADVIVVVLVGAVGVLVVALLLLGGARPHPPDLERWLAGQEPAYDSPPVLSRVRRSSGSGDGDRPV